MMKQSTTMSSDPSFCLFDVNGNLLDWNQDFAGEFCINPDLLAKGMSAEAILAACFLPKKALNLSWRISGELPAPAHYINKRQSFTVSYQRSAGGNILRYAKASTLNDHPETDLANESNALLRSSILQMSSSILMRRNQEEDALRAAHSAADEANRKLSSALEFTSIILQSSPVPIGVYASNGQCVEANQAYADLIGTSREVLLKQNFYALPDWDSHGLIKTCIAVLNDNTVHQREIHMVATDGKEVFAECRLLPVQINDSRHVLIQFIDLTLRKHLENELREYAFFDVLTRLPNRRLLVERMTQAIQLSKRQNCHLTLLFLDLNKFKALNDQYGHDAGDQLLIQVANRLCEHVRESDTVARLGGDEFVVLLTGLGNDANDAFTYTSTVSQKIYDALSEEYQLDSLRYHCTASIGINVFKGDATSIDHILREADAAMYKIKHGGAD